MAKSRTSYQKRLTKSQVKNAEYIQPGQHVINDNGDPAVYLFERTDGQRVCLNGENSRKRFLKAKRIIKNGGIPMDEPQGQVLALQENADQETVSTLLSISRSVLKEVSNREQAIKKTNRVVN